MHLGKEKININGKVYETLHFNFSSTDESLSIDKKPIIIINNMIMFADVRCSTKNFKKLDSLNLTKTLS